MPPRDDDGDGDDATDVERALIARLPPFLRRARAEDVARVATEVFGIGAKAAPLTSIEDVVRLLVRCEACGRVVLEDGLAAHALRRCDGGAAARDAANASANAKSKADATSERGGGAMGERKAVARAERGTGKASAGGGGRGAKLGGRESRTREPNYGKPKTARDESRRAGDASRARRHRVRGDVSRRLASRRRRRAASWEKSQVAVDDASRAVAR